MPMFKRWWNNRKAKAGAQVAAGMQKYIGYLKGLTDEEMGNVLANTLGAMMGAEDDDTMLFLRDALQSGGIEADMAAVALKRALRRGVRKNQVRLGVAPFVPWGHTIRAYKYPETHGLAREMWDHLRRGDKYLNNEDVVPYKDEDLRRYLDWTIG